MYYINRRGDKFVAEADIKEFASFNTNQEGESLSRKGQEILFDLLDNCLNQPLQLMDSLLGGG